MSKKAYQPKHSASKKSSVEKHTAKSQPNHSKTKEQPKKRQTKERPKDKDQKSKVKELPKSKNQKQRVNQESKVKEQLKVENHKPKVEQTPKTEQKSKTKPEKLKKSKTEASKGTIGVIVALCLLVLISYIDSGLKLKAQASQIKSDLKASIASVKENDIDSAEDSWDSARVTAKDAHKRLSNPAWRAVSVIPYFGTDIKSARTLLEVLDESSETLVKPGFELLKKYPMSALKLDDGFNADMCVAYLDLITDNAKALDEYATKIKDLEFHFIKFGNKGEIDKLSEIAQLFKDNEKLVFLMKEILGNGEDRFYIIPAQNMAEIRASGGFPGSVGSMEISDGVLKIGKFRPINDVIYYAPMPGTEPTSEEYRIFSGNLQYARDACYLPDFERCGEIWSASYEYKTNTPQVDGAISLTPTIIQDILSVTGETIKLSDDTEINGKNATKAIQRDIYFKYFKNGAFSTIDANEISDNLFAETAEKTLSAATKNASLSNLIEYLKILNKGFKDRTIMMWFDDDETEDLCKEIGCSGIIEPGVYFSCAVPSKLGWFFDMDTKIKAKNEGMESNEYEVTVMLKNTLTEEEADEVTTYVVGHTYGKIYGFLHFVAPKGSEIKDVKVSDGSKMKYDTYHGFDICYSLNINLTLDEVITVTYTITSEKPFELASTPTLSNYK